MCLLIEKLAGWWSENGEFGKTVAFWHREQTRAKKVAKSSWIRLGSNSENDNRPPEKIILYSNISK